MATPHDYPCFVTMMDGGTVVVVVVCMTIIWAPCSIADIGNSISTCSGLWGSADRSDQDKSGGNILANVHSSSVL